MPEEIRLRLPDDTERAAAPGSAALAVLRSWREVDAPRWLAARLDGVPIDLGRPLDRGGGLFPITFDDRVGKEILHHSAAHVLAKAMTSVFPDAKPTVGPGTEEGFYYDFDMGPITPEGFDRVRSAVNRIAEADEPFQRIELDRASARERFHDNPHKLRYIDEVPPGESISAYSTGDWVDLCRGPHVPSTGWVRGIHLLGFSAVTLGGTPDGLPLQRVRGVAFPTRPELEVYLKMRREAEARDHRVLGPKLDLFTFVEEAPGFPFWLPRGMVVRREIEEFLREQLLADGYAEIRTPLMFAQSVFETSGHWQHYRADMFLSQIDQRVFGIKPMNCPGAMLVFRSRSRSYRELPLRLAEWAPLHRLEASGTIHGMTRVREFVQDDAHIFLTEELIEPEVERLLAAVARVSSAFGLEWSYELSTRPDPYLGELAQWERAEAGLKRVLDRSGVPYRISPGEGAFYGPKIDIHLKDSLGRSWQTGTIQVDYQQPARFGLEYQGADGALHTPVVVHRTLIGSFERFLGILVEHTGGRLPPWLAPEQLRVLPVSERHLGAANELAEELRRARLRATATEAQDTLGKRVRTAEVEKVPYVAVLGDAEVEGGTVTVRVHGRKEPVKLARGELAGYVLDRVRSRSVDP